VTAVVGAVAVGAGLTPWWAETKRSGLMERDAVTSKLAMLTSVAAGIVVGVSGAVLLGWWLDIGLLKTVGPGFVSMKANTACALLAAGVAAYLTKVPPTPGERFAARVLAAAVVAIGGLTLVEYVAAIDLGIDEWLFREDPGAVATAHPGRMAPATTVCLLAIGLAQLLRERHAWLAAWLALVVLVLSMLALAGYAFGVSQLYRVGSYTSMAIHTAALLALLGLATIAAPPPRGFMEVALSPTTGGIVARQLGPLVPLLLFGLGWLSLRGEQEGLFDSPFAVTLMVLSGTLVALAVLLRVVRVLHGVDQQRQNAQDQLVAFSASLERVVAERTRELEQAKAELMSENNERRLAEEEVRRLSVTDELTGLHNRRGFFLLAEQDLKAARRTGASRTLFFIDVDGLKRVNDTRGHRAGDALLVDTAHALTASFREVDIMARLGGDEFAVLTAGSASGEAMIERVQAMVAQINQERAGAQALSLSIGSVLCAPAERRSLEELLAVADAAMYLHKHVQRPG
jgi:diguanylate cyclase (GGDEF)-like protein